MSNYIVRGVMKRQSKVKRHAFQYFQRGHRMLKIVVYATKQPFKIICKMGGNFFQSCEFDDMSPHLCQLDGVSLHEPWQNSYPWAWPTVLRMRGYTSQRFILSCHTDLKNQRMAHQQKQGGWWLHPFGQDHSS